MALNKLTKKITAIGTVGMLIATPLAMADNHTPSGNITGEVENTQDLETQVENLNVKVSFEEEVSIEGASESEEIRNTINEIKSSLNETQTEASFSIEGEVEDNETQVEVETEGELSDDQEALISKLQSQVEELLNNNPEAQVEIEVEAEIEVEEKEEESEEEESTQNNSEKEAEVKVEGVELTSQIQSTIDELKATMNNSTVETKIKVEGEVEEGESSVEVETEGNVSSKQQELISTLKTQIQELLAGVEGEAEVEIELETDVEKEADLEDKALRTSVGAEMRFAQLQARLDARAENAQLVLDELADTNISEEDKNTLENISSEFVALQNEMNQTTAPDAASFVAYKDRVIELSQEFKATATPYISAEMRQELQAKIQANQREEIEKRKDKIEKLRRQVNARIVSNTFGNISGVNAENLTQQYINGEISLGEVQSQIRTQFRGLPPQAKGNVEAQVQERRNRAEIQANINAQENRAEIREKVQERKDEIKRAVNKYKNLSSEKKEQIQQQIENISEERREQIRKQAENIADQIDVNASSRVEVRNSPESR